MGNNYIVQLGLVKVIDDNSEINCVRPFLGVSIMAETHFDALLCMNTVYDNDPACKLLEIVEEIGKCKDVFVLN